MIRASPSLTLSCHPPRKQTLFAIIDGHNSLQLVFQQQVVNPRGRAGWLWLAVNSEQALQIPVCLLTHRSRQLLHPRKAHCSEQCSLSAPWMENPSQKALGPHSFLLQYQG